MKYTCINNFSINAISDMKYASDGYAIILGNSEEVQIWDMLEKKCIRQLYFKGEKICKCACTPTSDKIVFASKWGKIFVFDKETLKFDKEYTIEKYVKSIEFDESERYIVVASLLPDETTQIRVYDMQTDQIETINFDEFRVKHTCFYPNEKNLLIIGAGECKQVNIASKEVIKTLSGQSHSYNEENYYDRMVQKMHVKYSQDFEEHFEEKTSIKCGIYNGNERWLYLGDTGGYIKVLKADSDRCIALLNCAKEPITSIMFSNDKELFTGISKEDYMFLNKSPIKIYNSGNYSEPLKQR